MGILIHLILAYQNPACRVPKAINQGPKGNGLVSIYEYPLKFQCFLLNLLINHFPSKKWDFFGCCYGIHVFHEKIRWKQLSCFAMFIIVHQKALDAVHPTCRGSVFRIRRGRSGGSCRKQVFLNKNGHGLFRNTHGLASWKRCRMCIVTVY